MKQVNKAIASFQSECPAIIKDTQAFKYRYADLAAIMTVIQPLLTKHGLLVSHSVADMHVITGIIHHESDEFVTTSTPILGCNTMQDLGSAITYARRYNISCLLNIITDKDDDGEAVSKKPVAGVVPGVAKNPDPKATTIAKFDRKNQEHQQMVHDILCDMKHADANDLVPVASARFHDKPISELKKFINDNYAV